MIGALIVRLAMLSAASAALVCALTALNRTASTLPPIEILDAPPPYVSVGTEAFVDNGKIYIIGSSAVVRYAAGRSDGRCGDLFAVKKLASILVHEEWHLTHPGDERGAYYRQLIALQEMGVTPGHAVYRDVQLSMQRVLELHKRARNKPDLVMAGR
jgi:hypothetical protein